MRDLFRQNGFFLDGTVQGLGPGPDTFANVDTYGRQHVRSEVPCHASDDNYGGINNGFLSRRNGDLPAPAGIFPWVQ